MTVTATASESVRRNRRPEFTERDGAALQWLGQQYGGRLDVLGVLLGRLGGHPEPLSKWGVRKQIERWERQRLVTTERALGDTWVTPTRYGLDRAGLPDNLPTWRVPITRVRHCHAVNIVRLWYEGRPDAATSPWVSERMTYLERGREHTWHVPDGVVKDPRSADQTGPPRFIAIEVELEHKGRRRYETEVFGKLRSGTGAVWYFVPDEAFRQRIRADITAVLDKRGATIRYGVDLLPEIAGVSYMTKR